MFINGDMLYDYCVGDVVDGVLRIAKVTIGDNVGYLAVKTVMITGETSEKMKNGTSRTFFEVDATNLYYIPPKTKGNRGERLIWAFDPAEQGRGEMIAKSAAVFDFIGGRGADHEDIGDMLEMFLSNRSFPMLPEDMDRFEKRVKCDPAATGMMETMDVPKLGDIPIHMRNRMEGYIDTDNARMMGVKSKCN